MNMQMKDFRVALTMAAQAIVDHKDFLTKADQAIGDGDHGVGMARGFKAFHDAVSKVPTDTLADMLSAGGKAIMSTSGGASGAIFGTFFSAAGKSMPQTAIPDVADVGSAFAAGLQAVMDRGKAKPGEKTMIDALDPAVAALKGATAASLGDALTRAATAARSGAEHTRDMIATTGKAKSLGERSLGHPDPGALTFTIFMEALAAAVAGSACH